MLEVCIWLIKFGLSEYVDRFEDELIDGDLLFELNVEMMLYFGILNLLYRKKFELFICMGWILNKK